MTKPYGRSILDGGMVKRTVAELLRERKGGDELASREEYSGEVILITLMSNVLTVIMILGSLANLGLLVLSIYDRMSHKIEK